MASHPDSKHVRAGSTKSPDPKRSRSSKSEPSNDSMAQVRGDLSDHDGTPLIDESFSPTSVNLAPSSSSSPCKNNDCGKCQELKASFYSDPSLESYIFTVFHFHMRVPSTISNPYASGMIQKISSIMKSYIFHPSCVRMFKVVADHGFGKTQLGKLWCAYYEGDTSMFEWDADLKRQCAANTGQFNVKTIDFCHIIGHASFQEFLQREFESYNISRPDHPNFLAQLNALLCSKNSKRWYLFLDNCHVACPFRLTEFRHFLAALNKLSIHVFCAASNDFKVEIPSLEPHCLGYTLGDIQQLFPDHLKMLQQIGSFKNSSDTILNQIAKRFLSQRDGYNFYPYHLINHVMASSRSLLP